MRGVYSPDSQVNSRELREPLSDGAAEDKLAGAAKALVDAVRICIEWSTGGLASSSYSDRPANYDEADAAREAALRVLVETPAVNASGLTAKAEALSAMVQWMDYEDSRVCRFAVELVAEYQTFLSRSDRRGSAARFSVFPPWRGLSRRLAGSITNGAAP